MAIKELKNKPLVEAILEIRWILPPNPQMSGLLEDPHYRLLLGRFSERVQSEYPFHEALPAATVPDNMVPHIVQHRFRVKEAAWPLVQMGPGIMTVNDTTGYKWADFQKRCETAISWLLATYPDLAFLKVQDLLLRYIDAIPFDFNAENVFLFLRDKMKVTLALPESLFTGKKVSQNPSGFSWEASFKQAEPEGTVVIRFAAGTKDKDSALVWETRVQSASKEIPDLSSGFPAWLAGAHDLTDDWFFKLIEGDLERRFSGD